MVGNDYFVIHFINRIDTTHGLKTIEFAGIRLKKMRAIYARFGEPSAANRARAEALVRLYNDNLGTDEIGYSDSETIRSVFPFQNAAQEMQALDDTHAPGVARLPLPGK